MNIKNNFNLNFKIKSYNNALHKLVNSNTGDYVSNNDSNVQYNDEISNEIYNEINPSLDGNLYNSSINGNSTNLKDRTERQDVAVNLLISFQYLFTANGYLNNRHQFDGKSISEIINILKNMKENNSLGEWISVPWKKSTPDGTFSYLIRMLENLRDNGYADYVLMEYNHTLSGGDFIALKDPEGNYLVYCLPTDAADPMDFMYDAHNILKNNENTSGLSLTTEPIYNGQQKDCYEFTKKYLTKASQENKKVYLEAYSLGGSLAENAVIELYENDYKLLKGSFGGLKLTNPYHDNLTKDEVQKIKNVGVKLYCAEGDMVSRVFNSNDFDNETVYLYQDYKSSMKAWESTNSFYIGELDMTDVSKIFGFTHCVEGYVMEDGTVNLHNSGENKAFDANGQAQRKVLLDDGSIYEVKRHTFSELSKYAFDKEFNSVDEMLNYTIDKTSSKMDEVINRFKEKIKGINPFDLFK